MKKILHVFGCIVFMLTITMGSLFSANNEKAKKPGWIGIAIQDVNEKLAKKTKLDSNDGAYVNEVVENSPADSAGIKEGDVIIEFGGRKIYDSDDLVKAVRRTAPGTKTTIVLISDAVKKTIQLTVQKIKGVGHQNFGMFPSIPEINVFAKKNILGLHLITLNEQLGEYFGAPNNEGVLVEEVEKESAADKAGFKAGDIIIRIGKKSVAEVERIKRELQKYDEGDKVEFELLRKGTSKKINIEIEEKQDFQNNFRFRMPNRQMFRFDPFDGAELNMDIEKISPELNRLKLDLEKTANHFKFQQQKIQEITPSNQPKLSSEVTL